MTKSNRNPYEEVDLGPERFELDDPGKFIEYALNEIGIVENSDYGETRQGIKLVGTTSDDAAVYFTGWSDQQKRAIVEADGRVGDTIRITYVGTGKPPRAGFQPPKLIEVEVVNHAVGDLPLTF